MKKETRTFKIKEMHCKSCERLIERSIRALEGIQNIKVSYADETAEITYDAEMTGVHTIIKKIEEKGYQCILLHKESNDRDDTAPNTQDEAPEMPPKYTGPLSKDSNNPDADEEAYSISRNYFYFAVGAGIAVMLIIMYLLLQNTGFILPKIEGNTSYILLFVAGLMTGFHCIAMCGGFVVSYTAKGAVAQEKPGFMSHLLYGIGKTISYTVIGGLFGLLGSFIAFTPGLRGAAAVISGLFLILFGLNMLNIFPVLRRFQIGMPTFLLKYITKKEANNTPFGIGLLNGLMIACGPLQAMYIYAAGTGSAMQGALSLLAFGLGTLPVLLGFGLIASMISSKLTHKILKISGILVIALGLIMLNRGLALTGSGYDFSSLRTSFGPGAQYNSNANAAPLNMVNGYQEIRMDVTGNGYEPNKFVLQKGVPVKWIINGKELNGCNKAIQVPKLNLRFDIKPGIQTIEFTPAEAGTISWSCWMGMIRGTFVVKDNLDLNDPAAVQQELNAIPSPKGGSCGMGGGCGCGG